MLPLCFVLMPFGRKPAGDGRIVDFDAIYRDLIHPAVTTAGLEPLRADEEMSGGVIHKAMFERLVLCEYAVADLTTANANVFYELGLRHAARPAATQLLFAQGWGQLPFDVNLLRALPYTLAADGTPAAAATDGATLTARLRAAAAQCADSPVYQMLEGFPDIQHLKTDVFRDRVRYAEDVKARLSVARKKGLEAVQAIYAELEDIGKVEAAVVIDLFLSYRAIKAWQQMIDLVARMAAPLATTTMVREQLALALNRAGRGDEAERVLLELISQRGVSSETCGILGRVYKDRWDVAQKGGNVALARGLLDKAIAAYVQGFEADWRDAYPGINAVTLMELRDSIDVRQVELLPLVRYAAARRVAHGNADYWDHATLLEVAVLARDNTAADAALASALAYQRETWEAETTARNLTLIADARRRRGEDVAELDGRIRELLGQA